MPAILLPTGDTQQPHIVPSKMVDGHVTIQVLSNDDLVCIFSFFRPHWHRRYFSDFSYVPVSSLTWAWHRLAHVCRRWRYLIFASPHRLGLGLVMSKDRRGTNLDLWPPLPISICYNLARELSPKDEQDVVAMLEHSDRIFEIKLTISNSLLKKSNALMESFPMLERLSLFSPDHGSTVFPSGLLGGPALTSPRLHYIVLEGVIAPTLPQLLLSSRGLIQLYLGNKVLAGHGFISPGVLAAALSAAAQLEFLHVQFHSNIHKEQGSTDYGLPPPNFVVLPSLIHFEFHGSNVYLEDLVSRIHAPLLERICVDISQKRPRPLHIPPLSQFISRTKRMSSLPFHTSICLEDSSFTISHTLGIRGHICFTLTCDLGILEVSQVIYICGQLFPLMSGVERVSIDVDICPLNPPDETDVMRWLRLFRLFDCAQELELGSGYSVYEVDGTPKMGQEVLPVLRVLRLDMGSGVPRFIKSFVTDRELTGRPIVQIRSCRHLENGTFS